MAHVTRDRAQLILVSGLTIAVTLLILVLLLNTAIYTENVATRGIDSDVSDAANFQQTIDQEVAAILAAEKRHAGSYDEAEANVSASVGVLLSTLNASSIEKGHLHYTSIEETTPGAIIGENMSESEPIDNVDRIRSLNITLVEGSWGNDDYVDADANGEQLTVNRTVNTIEVEVNGDLVCDVGSVSGNVTYDVTSGEIHWDDESETCEVSPWVSSDDWVDGDTIEFTVFGDEEARYEVVVAGTDLDQDYAEMYVDSVQMDLEYLSADLTYTTTRTIEVGNR